MLLVDDLNQVSMCFCPTQSWNTRFSLLVESSLFWLSKDSFGGSPHNILLKVIFLKDL